MSMYPESGARRSLSAMFDTRAEADRAVAALERAGIADVVLTGGDDPGDEPDVRDVRGDMSARERGFFEQLGDFFFPDEDRYVYAEGLNRGGFLVTIDNVPEHQYAQALDILDDEGAVDLDAREAEWRAEGWSYDPAPAAAAAPVDPGVPEYGRRDLTGETYGAGTDTLAGAAAAPGMAQERDGTIDVVEEDLRIAKRERDLGRVRVRSYVREIPVDETVNLREERVSIERRPVDRDATEADFRDQSIEAREYGEEAVVTKDARVVEEVALRTESTSRDEEVHDTIRKTEVEVEDDRGDTLNPDGTRRDPNRTF